MRRASPSFAVNFARVLVVALSACLLIQPKVSLGDTPAKREDRIKAALVFKLIKFVEWPAGAMGARDPIQICALGDSAVGDALAAVDAKPVRDRTALFRKINGLATADVRGCHALYVPAGSREISTSITPGFRGRGLLTISDAPDFARRGGMVGLAQGENRVAFEINLRAAREGGLEPAAPLLELSTVVE